MLFAPVVRNRRADPGFERFINEAFFSPVFNRLNLKEDEQAWTFSLDLPGVAKDQLTLGIEGNVVRLETKADAPRNYKAAYELPADIDADASEATLENGVLTLKLAKKQPVSNVRTLQVK